MPRLSNRKRTASRKPRMSKLEFHKILWTRCPQENGVTISLIASTYVAMECFGCHCAAPGLPWDSSSSVWNLTCAVNRTVITRIHARFGHSSGLLYLWFVESLQAIPEVQGWLFITQLSSWWWWHWQRHATMSVPSGVFLPIVVRGVGVWVIAAVSIGVAAAQLSKWWGILMMRMWIDTIVGLLLVWMLVLPMWFELYGMIWC